MSSPTYPRQPVNRPTTSAIREGSDTEIDPDAHLPSQYDYRPEKPPFPPVQPPPSKLLPGERPRPPPILKKRRAAPASPESPPGLSKRAKLENSGASTSASASDLKAPEEISLDGIEDISHRITMLSEHPSNVTGRFCDLFVGTHVEHGKVALKRPRIKQSDYTSGDVRRFIREADTWRSFSHDHVLLFVGTCRIAGYLYMVSPFAENGTLIEYVQLNPGADRARLLYETAQALAYLHSLGVVHGDLKGNNVLVSDKIRALLCDFGLSKFAVANTSTAQKTFGTLCWQSPELWEGHPKTFSSDVYAFSMTVAEVLTGRVPLSQYTNQVQFVLAINKNERPATSPMFNTVTKAPYYLTWRAAIHCWSQDPARRSYMDAVVQILKPLTSLEENPLTMSQGHQATNSDTGLNTDGVDPSPGVVLSNDLRQPEHDTNQDDADGQEVDIQEMDSEVYCYCEGDGFGEWVHCEGIRCDIEWFHVSCLGMDSVPQTEWLCLECEAHRISPEVRPR